MQHGITLPFLFCLLTICEIWSCKPAAPAYEAQKSLVADSAMVVSAHALASEAGLSILRAGGNAVDAAVATQLALAVVYPRAGNLGGGGFMVYQGADGRAAALDYREKAPALAQRDMYLDSLGQFLDSLSRYGVLGVGVPGTVAGLVAAHDSLGHLPWAELCAPAIRLAEEGFAISPGEAEYLNRFAADFKRYNRVEPVFYKAEGWQAGDRLRQKELAVVLRAIQAQGRAGFYEGHCAERIVAEMLAQGGLIRHEDLRAYEAVWREPLRCAYRGYEVLSMPPPSSGGIALAQMLAMLEPYPLGEWGFGSTAAAHAVIEAERRAFADRAEHLGDPDFWPVPGDSLLDAAYLQRRMAGFSPQRATRSDSLAPGRFAWGAESPETTHLSIVDAAGNAVSVTTTLNSNYGSKVVVTGAGFFLNNEMDDFSAKPGVPNQFGLVGAEANAIAPGKRMLSSMTPSIVLRGGRPYLVVGTPGGSTIITSVLQMVLNVIDFGMDAEAANRAPRFHHQWLPDSVYVEPGRFSPEVAAALAAAGHRLVPREGIGRVEMVQVLPDGRLLGSADPRGEDSAAGY